MTKQFQFSLPWSEFLSGESDFWVCWAFRISPGLIKISDPYLDSNPFKSTRLKQCWLRNLPQIHFKSGFSCNCSLSVLNEWTTRLHDLYTANTLWKVFTRRAALWEEQLFVEKFVKESFHLLKISDEIRFSRDSSLKAPIKRITVHSKVVVTSEFSLANFHLVFRVEFIVIPLFEIFQTFERHNLIFGDFLAQSSQKVARVKSWREENWKLLRNNNDTIFGRNFSNRFRRCWCIDEFSVNFFCSCRRLGVELVHVVNRVGCESSRHLMFVRFRYRKHHDPSTRPTRSFSWCCLLCHRPHSFRVLGKYKLGIQWQNTFEQYFIIISLRDSHRTEREQLHDEKPDLKWICARVLSQHYFSMVDLKGLESRYGSEIFTSPGEILNAQHTQKSDSRGKNSLQERENWNCFVTKLTLPCMP